MKNSYFLTVLLSLHLYKLPWMRYENNLTLKPGAHWASLTADKNLITGSSFLLCQKN